MVQSIGDAVVDVHADTTDFARELNQGVTKSTKGATKEMGGLEGATRKVGTAAKFALAGVAVGALAAVGEFARDSIRAYTDLNESVNAVNVVFGENADEVQRLGEAAARNLGLSNAEFNTLSVSVSAFTDKIAEGLGQDVPTTLDTLTTRIADFASVMNLDVADAFEKFRSGLAGESEPLRQFGIDVSAATVEQVALSEGIIETGETMTEADKVTARYLAIMEQTEKVSGDFANTSDDVANRQRIVNAEMENAKAELGEQLLPLQEAWLGIQENLIPVIGDVALAVADLTGAMSDYTAVARQANSDLDTTNEQVAALFTVAAKETGGAGPISAIGTSIRGLALTLIPGESSLSLFRETMAATLEEAELTPEALELAQGSLELLAEQYGLTASEVQVLSDLIDQALVPSFQDSTTAQGESYLAWLDQRSVLGDVTDAEEDLTDAINDNVSAMQEQQDTIHAQLDPVFALEDAVADQAAAQRAVTDAINDFGEGTPEHLEALSDLATENLALRDAEVELATSTRISRDAFIDQQIELGLTRAEAELLADEFAILNAFSFDPKTIVIKTQSGGVTTNTAAVRDLFRQHGGPVTAGGMYVVGEAGPEVFVPNVSGQIISNENMSNVAMGGVNVEINITGSVSDAQARRAGELAANAAIERLSRARGVR